MIGRVIVQAHSMLHGQRPQSLVAFFWPVKSCMEHDDSSSSADIFDGIFSHAIVMMPSHTTVSDGLVVLVKRFTKSLGGAHAIVSATASHSDAQRDRLVFKF